MAIGFISSLWCMFKFQKRPFKDPIKSTINEPKKKNSKHQSGKLIGFTKINGL